MTARAPASDIRRRDERPAVSDREAHLERLLFDALEALAHAKAGQTLFAAMLARAFDSSAPVPRDEELERMALAHLLVGTLAPSDIAELYDWHPLHLPLIERIRTEPDVTDAFLSRRFVLRPHAVHRALNRTIRTLPDPTPREHGLAVVVRLEALQLQRRALGSVLRALRELRALEGDHGLALVHLESAVRELGGT